MARDDRYPEASAEIQTAIDIAKRHLDNQGNSNSFSLWDYFMGPKSEEKKVGPIPNTSEENALSNLATFYINLGSVKLLSGAPREAQACCTEGEKYSKRAADQEAAGEALKCLQTAKETLEKSKKKKAAENGAQ